MGALLFLELETAATVSEGSPRTELTEDSPLQDGIIDSPPQCCRRSLSDLLAALLHGPPEASVAGVSGTTAAKRIGCSVQAMGLAQLIASRWKEGRFGICIDL